MKEVKKKKNKTTSFERAKLFSYFLSFYFDNFCGNLERIT